MVMHCVMLHQCPNEECGNVNFAYREEVRAELPEPRGQSVATLRMQ